jgi:hypothetical protein
MDVGTRNCILVFGDAGWWNVFVELVYEDVGLSERRRK